MVIKITRDKSWENLWTKGKIEAQTSDLLISSRNLKRRNQISLCKNQVNQKGFRRNRGYAVDVFNSIPFSPGKKQTPCACFHVGEIAHRRDKAGPRRSQTDPELSPECKDRGDTALTSAAPVHVSEWCCHLGWSKEWFPWWPVQILSDRPYIPKKERELLIRKIRPEEDNLQILTPCFSEIVSDGLETF